MAREEKGSSMGSINSGGSGDGGGSLAARRARLRGSLARASFPPDELQPESDTPEEPMPAKTKTESRTRTQTAEEDYGASSGGTTATAPQQPAVSISPVINSLAAASVVPPGPLPVIPESATEILTSIDGALSACATNLAALQRLSTEQTDVLKNLSTTLQNQTLFEIGLNLNSLTESLSAALEPMKAIGELVPALDQLVSTIEGRAPDGSLEKLSPDQLVTSLADQLSAGLIDSWTFKCAYMAIYPSEHPADLLHRLVELLGAQRLSGDLFRAAYEAVQAAEAPPRSMLRSQPGGTASGGTGNSAPGQPFGGEEIREKIEELQRANDELRGRQEQREHELQILLQQKEAELQQAQGMLNSRYQEFNARYEEVADALGKREDEYRTLLETKDMELLEKESELNLLRAQMEELRNQTEDMVKDLQRQLTDMRGRPEPPKAQPSNSFFDQAPQQTVRNPFEPAQQAATPASAQQAHAPASPTLPPHPAQQINQTTSQQMQAVQPPQNQGMVPPSPMAVQPPPAGQSPAPRQAAPQQPAPTQPFAPGAGSYGSGVRAQVFEVIVRQALAGAPWREICAGPMQVNNISADEVEAEVKRRQALLNK
jgi:hypothetical protein